MAVKLGQIIITLGIILMLLGVIFYVFIFDFLTAGQAVWTMDELEDKFYFKEGTPIIVGGVRTINWNKTTRDFRDLGPGDTVYLKDIVADFQYNSTFEKTLVWFRSTGMGQGKIKDAKNLHRDVILAMNSTSDNHKPYLFFDGDVTGDLTKGQVIAIELKIGGVKDDGEYIEQLGEPLEGGAEGVSTSDVIDIDMFQMMGLILIIAGGALLGVGAFIHFKKDAEKRPAAGAGDATPRKEVAGGVPTRQTKCPACGAGIPIAPGATSIKCGSCGRSYQIGAGATGAAAQRPPAAPAQAARQTKCPGCGTMISVPPGASNIKCHGCGRSYNVGGGAQRPAAAAPRPPAGAPQQPAGAQQAGARQSRCPGCGGNIVIPAGAKNVSCPSCKQSFRVG